MILNLNLQLDFDCHLHAYDLVGNTDELTASPSDTARVEHWPWFLHPVSDYQYRTVLLYECLWNKNRSICSCF